MIQGEHQTDQGEYDGGQLQRFKVGVLGGHFLFEATATDHRGQQDQRNRDDENRTPRQDAGHRAADGRADGGRDGDHERTDAHKTTDFGTRRLFEDDVDQQTESAAAHTLACKPSGDCSDKEEDDETL